LISGINVQKVVKKKIEKSLKSKKIKFIWHTSRDNQIKSLNQIQKNVKKDNSDLIVGIGGGRSVDTAKLISFNLDKPFVSLPTAASHDGMASPFVSVKSDKPHSIVASAPMGVFVDIDIIKNAPSKLLSSGCGDLIANIIAVKDWKLGHKKKNEYYGRYAANLALMSAEIVMENSSEFAKNGLDARVIVEGLISAGVASCIAGSSRPCSGAEHLFSHALDKIAPGIGLHGEKCGLGSIMMAKLHKQDWRKIVKTLKDVGAPTTAKQIGLNPDVIIKALTMAQELRPERYTILKEIKMTEKKALSLAKSTKVI
jgi:glycerol-1-phosphate dehydrogenase [NAD(P)+]